MEVLSQWLNDNEDNPYISQEELLEMSKQLDLTPQQIKKWLIFQRNKLNIAKKYKIKIKTVPKKNEGFFEFF